MWEHLNESSASPSDIAIETVWAIDKLLTEYEDKPIPISYEDFVALGGKVCVNADDDLDVGDRVMYMGKIYVITSIGGMRNG